MNGMAECAASSSGSPDTDLWNTLIRKGSVLVERGYPDIAATTRSIAIDSRLRHVASLDRSSASAVAIAEAATSGLGAYLEEVVELTAVASFFTDRCEGIQRRSEPSTSAAWEANSLHTQHRIAAGTTARISTYFVAEECGGAAEVKESLSLSDRFKKLTREYGRAAVGVYFLLSILDMPFFFLLVQAVGTEKIAYVEHKVVSAITTFIPESVQQSFSSAWSAVMGIFKGKKDAASEAPVEGWVLRKLKSGPATTPVWQHSLRLHTPSTRASSLYGFR
uniref:DUF1279 domain-containing protein n=1 Tax=Bionectria ochroleuca TaxID=29856 RepID=A0A8H7NFQ3_BIOOC